MGCFFWRNSPQWARTSSFTRFLDHTQRRITVGRTPLDEGSARYRDLYLTTLTTDTRAPGGIRTHNLSRRAAVDLRLRPRGRWDRQRGDVTLVNNLNLRTHMLDYAKHRQHNTHVALRKTQTTQHMLHYAKHRQHNTHVALRKTQTTQHTCFTT